MQCPSFKMTIFFMLRTVEGQGVGSRSRTELETKMDESLENSLFAEIHTCEQDPIPASCFLEHGVQK